MSELEEQLEKAKQLVGKTVEDRVPPGRKTKITGVRISLLHEVDGTEMNFWTMDQYEKFEDGIEVVEEG